MGPSPLAEGRKLENNPSLPDMQKLECAFLQKGPRKIKRGGLVLRVVVQRLRTACGVDLNELHEAVHPGRGLIGLGRSESAMMIWARRAMDLPSPDLDHTADRNRLVAPEIQDPLQDQVGVQSRGPKRGCIAGLERQREQHPRVKRPVMVGITRQDKVMRQRFGIIRVQFAHEVSRPKLRR